MLHLNIFYKLVLVLSAFSCVLSEHLDLNEGANCTFNKLDGQCISEHRCLSSLELIKPAEGLATCNKKGEETIVCCTDCKLVKDTRNFVVDKYLGSIELTGDKAQDYCIKTMHELDFPCKRTKELAVFFEVDKTRNCKDVRPRTQSYPLKRNYLSWKDNLAHLAILGYGPNEEFASSNWTCGGSIISNKFIVTSANCLSRPGVGPVQYVGVGVRKRSDPSSLWERYNISRVIPHPEYKPPALYNDIALLETAIPISFSKNIRPICLPGETEPNESPAEAATIGGFTHVRQKIADHPHSVNLNRFSEEECKPLYPPSEQFPQGYNSTTHLCYGFKSLGTPCSRNNGSPLLKSYNTYNCGHTLLGVASTNRTCTISGGSVLYTNIYFYKPWIQSIVWP